MNRRILVLALAIAVVTAACGDDDDGDPQTTGSGGGGGGRDRPDSGTLVEGDDYHGVLLDAHLDYLQPEEGPGIDDGVESFVPTEDEVATFEAGLEDALADAVNPTMDEVTADDLPDYVRQYTGVAADDLQQLVVGGFCASAADDDGFNWQDSWIQVADGGTCFWEATMDLASNTIIRFAFNGSA